MDIVELVGIVAITLVAGKFVVLPLFDRFMDKSIEKDWEKMDQNDSDSSDSSRRPD